MKYTIFSLTTGSEILATLCVAISIACPAHRFWPPPKARAWQGYLMWLLYLAAAGGVIALGIVDWNSWNLIWWPRFLFGLPLWLAGNGVTLWAMIVLGLEMTFGDKNRLVQGWPYRFSRNPQYLGFIVGLLGWGVMTNSGLTLAAVLTGCLPLALVPFAEEPWLAATYGAAYREYKIQTARFLSMQIHQ